MTGYELRAIREEMNMLQSVLGAALDRTSGSVANWEKGRVAVPEWAAREIRQMLREFRRKKVLQSA